MCHHLLQLTQHVYLPARGVLHHGPSSYSYATYLKSCCTEHQRHFRACSLQMTRSPARAEVRDAIAWKSLNSTEHGILCIIKPFELAGSPAVARSTPYCRRTVACGEKLLTSHA